ncbi:Hint domain-containing protein [Methylobacterium sp. J-043]|nr:Hint domain-containing protein [Methylobacterium sp. J-043]
MALPITFNNTTYSAGFLGTDDGGASGNFQVDTASTYSVSVSGTINVVGDPVTLTYGADAPAGFAGTSIQLTSTQFDNSGQILFVSRAIPPGETAAGNYRYLLSNTQVVGSNPPAGSTRTRFLADGNNTLGDYNVQAAPCFTTGTLIRTARGEVAVEDLTVGDLAVTASGTLRPITWIGNRALDAKSEALPHNEQPIRIRAGAFGPGLPARDLRLSHGHPVLVGADANGEGGVLVPVMCLINGTSIVREPATQVTYWHVELDAHDILLAEGLAAESYYDMGSRVWFAGEDGMLTDPNFVPAGEHGRCRPVAVDGAFVERERARLDGVFAAELDGHSAWTDMPAWLAA